MDYKNYPRLVVEDIVRLRRRIAASKLPDKLLDHNLIIGTWNIRAFGKIHEQWEDNPDSPKRNLRAMAYIAEIVRRFDVIAIQEVKWDTSGIHRLLTDFLGSDWGMIVSDVSAGPKGNGERLSYLYDKRRVQPSGLTGEIVLPPTDKGDPVLQFDRTPYIAGFKSAGESFTLLTAHIKYGDVPADRLGELKSLAEYIAKEIRDRSHLAGEENNTIILGDFNIDERGNNPLFQAFVATGLVVPAPLLNLQTTYNSKPKYYDQIAWFMGELDLLTSKRAGVINFGGAIFQELSLAQMSYRMSDHFPLWVEFITNRSVEAMSRTLGVNPDSPDPFSVVPD